MKEARKGVARARRIQRPARRRGTVEDFPGCKAVPLNATRLGELEAKLGDGPRIEYWEAREQVAWMVREAPSVAHERPAHRLPVLLDRIAQARGAAIECYGALTFYEQGAQGEPVRAMEADQTVYLNAERAQALRSPVVVLSGDAPPDVVLEVDNTTDVRRRKLDEYRKWRFPEVWVEVPDAPAPSRPMRRGAALTIYRLDANTGLYRKSAASHALPGWTDEEIHLALNEPSMSITTSRALQRVGRALGQLDGTKPTDDPLLRRLLLESHAEGEAAALVAAARQILAQRGIVCSDDLLADGKLPAGCGAEELVAATLACHDEADFLTRLGRRS